MQTTRRELLSNATAFAGLAFWPSYSSGAPTSDDEKQCWGVSPFGDLDLPEDFTHFPYANVSAPKGGALSLQPMRPRWNQNPNTFNTLNIHVLNGDGAAGMELTFDSLMIENLDERNALYPLVADSVFISKDKLLYRFTLNPNARFHDMSTITALDVEFSLNSLMKYGHPNYRSLLQDISTIRVLSNTEIEILFSPNRNRDSHVIVAMMPIFSSKYWENRDFSASTLDPPLGSGPYRVKSFEPGRFIEFDRVADYWAKELPSCKGLYNFDSLKYEYFRESSVAFEAFKAGVTQYREETNPSYWATGYDFPAFVDGRVQRISVPNQGQTPILGWIFNTRREQFVDPRIRQAISLAFDFEWVNKNLMYSEYTRVQSFFENSDMKAVGLPTAAEIAALGPLRDRLPTVVFEEPVDPPTSDGSGSDRKMLQQAITSLEEAGCRLDTGILKMPSGKPLQIEFLNSSRLYDSQTDNFAKNLAKIGISTTNRLVDPVQFAARKRNFDFDIVPAVYVGSLTPGPELRNVYGSSAANEPGSLNLAGVSDTAIDLLIEKIENSLTRDELIIWCRALDRALRADHIWTPMWYRKTVHLAFWSGLQPPPRLPNFSLGFPSAWWLQKSEAAKSP